MAAVLYIAITTLILIAVLYKKAQKKIEAFLKRIENLEKQVQNLQNEIDQIKKSVIFIRR